MNQIRIGLPKGSLNTVGRGNTQQIFIDAGYDIQGYEPGNESDQGLSIVNDPEIIARLTRPQSAPVELGIGLLDIAIIGEDWVKEESVNDNENSIKKIGDLDYGPTRLVIAVPNEATYKSLSDFFQVLKGRKKPILCFTEYVNLTRQKFMQNGAYQEIFGNIRPVVRVRGLVDGENGLVQIINSDGVTEGYIAKGADIVVDTTQTGRRLKEYGLRELEEIMKSSAGLYAGPSCIGWKARKADKIFEQLKGVVVGREYFDIKFNVPNQNLSGVISYLISEGLCADEPTVASMGKFSAINILIPRGRFPQAWEILSERYKASALVRNEVKQLIK